MLTEISVGIFGLLIGGMIRFICLVLLRIFDDFRKVFDAVLQLADSLLCYSTHDTPGGRVGLWNFCITDDSRLLPCFLI